MTSFWSKEKMAYIELTLMKLIPVKTNGVDGKSTKT